MWKLSVNLGLKMICSFCSLHREKIWIIIVNLINVRIDVGVLRRLNYLSAKVRIFCQNYVIQNTALLCPTTMAHSHSVLPFLVAICTNRITWIGGILAICSLFHYIRSYYGWWYPVWILVSAGHLQPRYWLYTSKKVFPITRALSMLRNAIW